MVITFSPYYEQTKIVVLCVMFFFFFFSIVKDKYLPMCHLIILSFMPGTLFPLIGKMRFELIFSLLAVILIFTKNKVELIQNNQQINRKVLIFFIIVFLSVFQSLNFSLSWDYFYRLVTPNILFYLIIVCFCNKISDLRSLFYCYLFVLSWHAYLPVYNYLTGTFSFGHERLGTGGVYHHVGEVISGHVGLANAMSEALSFAYFLFFYEKKIVMKILCLSLFILFILAIFASGSRGGVIGLVVCSFLYILKAKKKAMAIGASLVLLVVFLGLNPHYLTWYSSILQGSGADSSASGRIAGLSHGIQMCIKRPILGVGIGCFSYARSIWWGWNVWAHNHYGELIGELGLFGVFSWFAYIIACFKAISNINLNIKLRQDIDPLYHTILNICWSVLILRLIIGMTTHSLMSFIWYMVGGVLLVVYRCYDLQTIDTEQ